MMDLGFDSKNTAEEVIQELDLSGKTYVVTGCNSGLGYETCRVLALRGAHDGRGAARGEVRGVLQREERGRRPPFQAGCRPTTSPTTSRTRWARSG